MKRQIPVLLAATTLLGACSTLPSSGPTGAQVLHQSDEGKKLGLSVVEVDSPSAIPAPTAQEGGDLTDLTPPPTDMVGPGDVLDIAIYEAGVTLFANGLATGQTSTAGIDSGVKAQTLPQIRVDDAGDISIPYAGKLHVMGKTLSEIGEQISRALKGFSQNPQVVVSRALTISSAVIVGGEVGRPGRLALQTNHETLSDVIALSGGYKGKADDLVLRVVRGNRHMDVRLSTLLTRQRLDMLAYPGDRLTLLLAPQSFSVLGAAGRTEQFTFPKASIALSQAIAMAGGPHPGLGDPQAVFIFRYTEDAEGKPKAVVYHINMMNTASYFLSQNFQMHDKDVLYFGNAKANQPSKMIQLISQLFTPFLTVVNAASVLKL